MVLILCKDKALDPCLFIRHDMFLLVYVDDVILVARTEEPIDKLIESMTDDLELTTEGDVTAFLGIQFERDSKAGTIALTQKGLIDRVLKVTGLQDCNPDKTPAATEPVGKDIGGLAFQEEWSYFSVVGMLLYLASNSITEIANAVHQCARFTHDPKQSHGQAVNRICRFLKGTIDKGIVLKPTDDLTVDCFIDADFAGQWNKEDPRILSV